MEPLSSDSLHDEPNLLQLHLQQQYVHDLQRPHGTTELPLAPTLPTALPHSPPTPDRYSSPSRHYHSSSAASMPSGFGGSSDASYYGGSPPPAMPPQQQQQVFANSRGDREGYYNGAGSSSAYAAEQKQNSVVIKVGMVGDAQIGKTSLMVKYVEGSFDEDYIQTLGMAAIACRFHSLRAPDAACLRNVC